MIWQPPKERACVELGKQIKRHRAERGLSQEDLAAAIYVSRQTISNWETDRTYPDVENLLLLSALFDVTIDELVKGDVTAMEKSVDEDVRRLSIWSWVYTLSGLASLLALFPSIKLWGIPGVILPAILLVAAGLSLRQYTRITKKHDVETFREILAFVKGDPIERDEHARSKRRRHRALKVIGAALVGAAVGALVGYFIGGPWIYG